MSLRDKQIVVYIKNELKFYIDVCEYSPEAIIYSKDGIKQLLLVDSLSAIVYPDDNNYYSLEDGASDNIIQNFLTSLLNEGKMISVSLCNTRKRISGTICGFNQSSVTMQHVTSNEKQAIFLNAISTISPYIETQNQVDKEYGRLNYRNTRSSSAPKYDTFYSSSRRRNSSSSPSQSSQYERRRKDEDFTR